MASKWQRPQLHASLPEQERRRPYSVQLGGQPSPETGLCSKPVKTEQVPQAARCRLPSISTAHMITEVDRSKGYF
jgi:hypothetical protein